MGSINSHEENPNKIEELAEKVELLYKFAEALDSRVDSIIPTTSKFVFKRAHKIEKDIEKVKESIMWKMIIVLIVLAMTISVCIAFIVHGLKSSIKVESTENIDALQEQMTNYELQLRESANEISQLKDRLAFLSFLPAVYNPEVAEEEDASAVEEMQSFQLNWREYVNLFTIGQNVPLPTGIDTNTFRCMDYRTITDLTSWQHKIQLLSTTSLNGLRVYNHEGKDYYTVALATAYGIDLGNAYEVELENGTIFYIVHAEYKHDIRYPRADDYGDPDVNYDEENTISVIEFIYDWQSAPQRLIDDGEANRFLGDNCDIYGDGCNIKRMTYLGKIWNAT